jgi:16S rRNA (cytosine1402-N4)-methyltransferase
MAGTSHVPVLLEQAVAALAIRPDGIVVDGTFGRGGHSKAILARLGPKGVLVAVDRDPEAEAAAGACRDHRFRFRRAWFSELPAVLDAEGLHEVDGVLLDLGIASPQIDEPARGFSLRADGPLDMRMDPSRGQSAAEWLAQVSERELRGVIADYGEERFAQQIARTIVARRALEPITRTRQLAAIVGKAVGARGGGDWSQDPATRTFQAVRIFINQELQELPLALEGILPRLRHRGRLAVISFHSLEDRVVKQFMRRHSQPFGGDARMARLPIATRALPQPPLALVGRAIHPGDGEIAANPRARSATLRVAERTQAVLA